MKEKLLKIGKITIVLLLSFGVVRFFSPILFLSDTPQHNPRFISLLQEKIEEVSKSPTQFIASLFTPKSAPTQTVAAKKYLAPEGFNPAQVVFTQMSKGVYAGEDKITKTKYIKYDNDVKLNVTEYEFEGKKIYLYEPEAKQ